MPILAPVTAGWGASGPEQLYARHFEEGAGRSAPLRVGRRNSRGTQWNGGLRCSAAVKGRRAEPAQEDERPTGQRAESPLAARRATAGHLVGRAGSVRSSSPLGLEESCLHQIPPPPSESLPSPPSSASPSSPFPTSRPGSAEWKSRRGCLLQLGFFQVAILGACHLAPPRWLGVGPAWAEPPSEAVAATAGPAAEETNVAKETNVLDNVLSLFDPDTTTKSGRRVPKAYVKSAQEVVRTLRESLSEDPTQDLKFRRAAESAKEAIRNYLGGWKGVPAVVEEESYMALEMALRELSSFYIKKGPRAAMPEDVKGRVLAALDRALDTL